MHIDAGVSAVVTGAASGLGQAVADALASLGAKVAVLDRDVAQGRAVAERVGGIFCDVDVTDSVSVDRGLLAAAKAHGVARVVVNCAGICPAAKTVSRGAAHDAALFQKTIDVNLIGTFNVASQAAAAMVASDTVNADGERGVIINTASVAAIDGQVGQLAYAASKGGVVSMTLPMARDLSDKGIRAVAIAPGIFATPMVEAFPENVKEALAANIPFPSRLGKPEEFAALAIHIVQNAFLNGELIRLDGATRMPPR
jgi:NAD(P)-dependent dehydrogenase (short-subunit alcohol dehydrogenase family)